MKDEAASQPTLILTPSIWDAPSEPAVERTAPAYTELLMEVLLLGFVIALMVGLSIAFPITPANLVDGGYRDYTMEAER